jgi:putative zinc ribbon protein
MEETYRNCQSCGMPFKRDEKGGGTNADGSRSRMYCSHCWANGAFTMPEATVGQMQDLVKGKLRELGFPGFMTGFFTRNIPKLRRWSAGGAR